MRGDSLPGGSEMEFEARGLPARPKQPQGETQYQAPQTEESRPYEPENETENRQQDIPTQSGKKEDVSDTITVIGPVLMIADDQRRH
jgi:hypothetical protein